MARRSIGRAYVYEYVYVYVYVTVRVSVRRVVSCGKAVDWPYLLTYLPTYVLTHLLTCSMGLCAVGDLDVCAGPAPCEITLAACGRRRHMATHGRDERRESTGAEQPIRGSQASHRRMVEVPQGPLGSTELRRELLSAQRRQQPRCMHACLKTGAPIGPEATGSRRRPTWKYERRRRGGWWWGRGRAGDWNDGVGEGGRRSRDVRRITDREGRRRRRAVTIRMKLNDLDHTTGGLDSDPA